MQAGRDEHTPRRGSCDRVGTERRGGAQFAAVDQVFLDKRRQGGPLRLTVSDCGERSDFLTKLSEADRH